MKPKKSKNLPPSRKQLRKQHRIEKKQRRNQYYTNRNKVEGSVTEIAKPESPLKEMKNKDSKKTNKEPQIIQSLSAEESRKREQKQQNKLQKQMMKQRSQQLRHANEDEDKTIRKLEKQLKLHKRKSKSIPKSFTVDGLDYLLEICDPETMENAALAEQQLEDANNEFEEDLALMTGQTKSEKNSKAEDDDDNRSDDSEDDISSDEDDDHEDEISDFDENDDAESEIHEEVGKKRQISDNNSTRIVKKVRFDEDANGSELEEEEEEEEEEELEDNVEDRNDDENKDDGAWEDIYGRLRAKDGSVIEQKDKYIPPAIRAKLETASMDKDRLEKLNRLKRQLKGLLNRLAESNMYTISNQIEALYMNNSRNDMNNTITNLMLESIMTNTTTPERLLIEHIVLITILHANVGTEVGAHFLQTIVKKFDELYNNHKLRNIIENKTLDNVINTISQLYNFKLFDSRLIYDILTKLTENFEEKDVECILHILKSVGFNLRKDDPVALKNLILNLQKRAASATETLKDNPRIKFMLEILLAIKNNNISKIPNYDNTYPEHLKKIMKTFIRKGNYVTQLNITLTDLLSVEERGRWWVVGSAWKGNLEHQPQNENQAIKGTFSQQLLDLAKKQRMNTDTRRNIFCIIMSAEDYMDAFEKLLRLGLKNQQERDIIHVILQCCLQEKNYNPYYSVLAQKFCEYDRKYQLTIKYSIWDKLKTLKDCSSVQISNLAKFLTHLFLEKSLSISILKIIQFSELDKINLRFTRQILLGILLSNDFDACQGVFENIVKSDKLKTFRESLRLFIHHFLLRNLKTDNLPEKQRELLEQRGKIIDKILSRRV